MDKFLGTTKTLYTTSRGGYITLISVLVVGAVGTAIAVSLLLLSLGAGRTSFAGEQSAQARALADACIETALQEIRDSGVCSGGGETVFDRGSCTSVVTADGANCQVDATSLVGSVVRRVQTILSSTSPIAVGSWREVADF